MKFLIAFALFAAASASIIPPAVIASTDPEIQEILAAISSPSTHPATAAALEQLLLDILGVSPQPIVVEPALVDYEPISVGPALIDFPLPDGGAVTAVDPTPADSSVNAPLVQIILNIKSGSDVVIEGLPAGNPPGHPVQVIDNSIVPQPVIDNTIVPEPVMVVDQPEAPETVIVAQPIITVPAIVLPDDLN